MGDCGENYTPAQISQAGGIAAACPPSSSSGRRTGGTGGTGGSNGLATCTGSHVFQSGDYLCNEIGGNEIEQCVNGSFVVVATCDCTVTDTEGLVYSTHCGYSDDSSNRQCLYGSFWCVLCQDGQPCQFQ